MKILHFNYSLTFGGIETMLVNIVNEQVSLGHDVRIIVLWNRVESTIVDRIDSRVKIHFINKPQSSINLYYYLKLNTLLASLNYDILHVHSAKLSDYIWIPKARNKMCLTQHRNCNGVGCDRIRKFKNIFAISKCVQQDIKETFGLDSKVIYNGIQPEVFKVNLRKYSEIDSSFHIVQLGRLAHQDKGQHIVLQALSVLKSQGYNNVKVDFIGDGPSKQYLIELAKELGVYDIVEFIGAKSPEYIYENLCKYDLEVQPSLFEGFGLTVAEAMIVKLPVLVADNLGPMEIVDYGKYGYVFKIGDYKDCANKIIDIISNGYNNSIVERAQKRIQHVFNVKNTALNYILEYERIRSLPKEGGFFAKLFES